MRYRIFKRQNNQKNEDIPLDVFVNILQRTTECRLGNYNYIID